MKHIKCFKKCVIYGNGKPIYLFGYFGGQRKRGKFMLISSFPVYIQEKTRCGIAYSYFFLAVVLTFE